MMRHDTPSFSPLSADTAKEASPTLISGKIRDCHRQRQAMVYILSAIERRDMQAAEQLLPLVYEELRKLAAQRLAEEKPGQTLGDGLGA